MTRKTSKLGNKKTSNKAGSASKNGSASSSSRNRPSSSKTTSRTRSSSLKQPIINERAKVEISGIVIIVLAIVIFAALILPEDAIITSQISFILKHLFGSGSYLLPIILLISGIVLIVKPRHQRIPARCAIGMLIIYVAILGFFAFATPGVFEGNLVFLFEPICIVSLGGIVGGGLVWLAVTLFGPVITVIILIGMILAGCIVIGFSITAVASAIKARIKGNDYTDEELEERFARFPESIGESDAVSFEDEQATKELDTYAYQDDRTASIQQENRFDQMPTASLEDVTRDLEDINFNCEENKPMTRRLGRTRISEPEQVESPSSDDASSQGDDSRLNEDKTPRFSHASSTIPDEDGFLLPPVSLLATAPKESKKIASENELRETAILLQQTIESFGIQVKVVGWIAGPTVTLFKVDLPAGVRVSRIMSLSDDIALALASPGVRIFAPIPGTNNVGIEVPNRQRQSVLLGDILKDVKGGPLEVAIGMDVEGKSIIDDLAQMPHLLIGGTTGSGKSVSINAMIMTILMRSTPNEVRFILIDPKRVEFTPYNGIPHLYVPVVTEPKEAASALSWGVAEMERRLKMLSKYGARNIQQFNDRIIAGDPELENECKIPYIVIVIDELADLMMNVGKEVEFSISRLAQLARAAGIHLIVATQRPSTNVVTGLIKANITNRIALNVASSIDSRVILDAPGADNLIGNGDLLFSKPSLAKPQRIQGCYVSEKETKSIVDFLKEQGEPDYHGEILKTNVITLASSQPDGSGGSTTDDDPLIWEAADIVVSSGFGSTSNLQRRLRVGYARAGRIMDLLEEKGIVEPANGSKPREVLCDELELESMKTLELNLNQTE